MKETTSILRWGRPRFVGTRSKLALYSVYIFMAKEAMKKLLLKISFIIYFFLSFI